MGVRRKVFYPVAFASMLFASSAMAKINPTAFVGVTDFFLKDKSKDMTFYSPTLGATALELGLMENLIFRGPFEAAFDAKGNRDYTRDKSADPLWNLAKTFFPSSNGQLGTTFDAAKNFARYVKNPKTVALLLEYAKQVEDVPGKGSVKPVVTKDFEKRILDTLDGVQMQPKAFMENVLTPLLKHLRLSIEAGKKGTSLYPRHTTEQVIEAFFCYHFNTQADIRKLLEELDGSIVDKSKPLPKQDRYLEEKDLPAIAAKPDDAFNPDDFFALANAYMFTSLTPYRAGVNLLNNGSAQEYDRQKNAYIEGKTFSDCVETSLRHISNLLLFNPFSREFDLKNIETFVERQQNSSGIKNPYFENFQKFYEVQKALLANAGDIGMRSLWNTVFGDLPNTAYRRESHNEIKSGFHNLLTTANTVFSLSLKDFPKTGGAAQQEHWVKESLEGFFSALNPTYAYAIDLKAGFDEGTGDARITTTHKTTGEKLFSFNLHVGSGHTEVNEFTLIKKPSDIDYTNDLQTHSKAFHKGTTEESLLALASPDLQKDIHPFYQLYAQPLSDNASKIKMLETLSENYASWKALPEFKNNRQMIQSIVKNTLNGISWDDPVIVGQIIPVLKSLQNDIDLAIKVDSIKKVKSPSISWDDIKVIDKSLPKLNSLILGYNPTISQVSLTDEFKNLKNLSFRGSTRLEKIDNLGILSNLEVLDFGNTALKEVSVRGLSSVKNLLFSAAPIEKIEGLESLSTLEDLDLEATNLKEVSVKGLTNLKNLTFERSLIETIEGLNTLAKLENLNLGGTQPKELSLEGLISLKKVSFENSSIKAIGGFNDLAKLESLNFRYTSNLEEIDLKGLDSLKGLSFQSSAVKKINNLGTLSNLEGLDLSRTNNLEEVDLRGLTKLKKLTFMRSSVKKINDLGSLSQLEELGLGQAFHLEKIDLTGLSNLKKLGLNGANLAKVAGLDTLSSLEELYLAHSTGVKELSFNSLYNNLRELDLENSDISSLKGLEYSPTLKTLRLNGVQNIQELAFTQDNKDLRIFLQGSGIQNRSQIKGIEHLDEDKIEW